MTLQIPTDIHLEATKIIKFLDEHDEWPEDDWYSLGDDWDMNIYMDPEPTAVLYAVVDGQTQTDRYALIFGGE